MFGIKTKNATKKKTKPGPLPGFVPLSEWSKKPQAFSDLLPYAVRITRDIVMNKDGSLTATFKYRGEDLASQTPSDRAEVAKHLNDAVTNLGAQWILHFHSVRRVATGYPGGSHFNDPTSQVVDEVRKIQFNEAGSHYVNEQWLDLTFLPPPDNAGKGESFFIEGRQGGTFEVAAKEALKTFNEKIIAFMGYVKADLNLERVGCLEIDDEFGTAIVDEQLAHFIECATSRLVPVALSPPESNVSEIVGCEPVDNSFRLQIGDKLVAALVVKDLPTHSVPGMFEVLNQLPYEYRVCWRFIVREHEKALADIEIERKKWYQKRRGLADAISDKETRHPNQHAIDMSDDAQQAINTLSSGEIAIGWFTMTVVFWEKIGTKHSDDAWGDLMKRVDNVSSYLNRQRCQTYFEKENILEAFLGTLPANGYAQVRRNMLSSRNLADFVPTTAVWEGKSYAPCPYYPPESPPLAKVSTSGKTPFSLNLHVEDIGHFMIAGASGAGKSVFLGFLLIQHRRYLGSRQIILDIDRSHYTLCKSVGGAHFDVGIDSDLRFAPFAHIGDDASELRWAVSWVIELLNNQGVSTQGRGDDIYKALYLLAVGGAKKSLSNLVLQPYLTQEERQALKYYTLAGSFSILDGEDDFVEGSDFVCYELAGLRDFPAQFQRPFLTYLFHRIERQCDGSPTMIVLEEVWTFLDNEQSKNAIARWLRTLRKSNVAVGFASQNLEDYTGSPIASTIIGSCLTKIFLANPNAVNATQREVYKSFGLTYWQTKIIANATRQREYYVTSPEGKRMITLDLTPPELAFIGVSNKDLVKEVRKIVDAERSAIINDPTSLRSREPWQATWLRRFLREGEGDAWANYWLETWRSYGGWSTTIRKMSATKSVKHAELPQERAS